MKYDISTFIIYIFSSMLNLYSVKTFFDNFLGEKRDNRLYIVCFTLYYLLDIISFMQKFHPVIITFICFLLFVSLSLNYKSTMKNRVLFSIMFIAIGLSAEHIVGYTIGILSNTAWTIVVNNTSLVNIAIASSNLTILLIVKLLCKIFDKKDRISLPLSYWTLFFTLPTGSLFVLFCVFAQVSVVHGKVSALNLGAACVLLLMDILIFFFYSYIRRSYDALITNTILDKQNEYYRQQYQLLEETHDEILTIKHDMKGHLDAILLYLEHGESLKAKHYIESLQEKTPQNIFISDCGILAIDGILNSKLGIAIEKNIKVKSKISIIDDINVNPVDMTIILNNLLDNAIEACEKLSDNKFIDVDIAYEKNNLFITISNSCDEDLLIINDGNFITTKLDEKSHGYGIKSIQKVLESYDGGMKSFIKDERFTTCVFLYAGCMQTSYV